MSEETSSCSPVVVSLRSAFDFGSGATKLCVARMTKSNNSNNNKPTTTKAAEEESNNNLLAIDRVLYEEEATVLLGHSFKMSSDGTIGSDVIHELFSTVRRFIQVIEREKLKIVQEEREALLLKEGKGRDVVVHDERFAAATAVYREARNGEAVLSELHSLLGTKVVMIPQAHEGRLGFLTGVLTHCSNRKSQDHADDDGNVKNNSIKERNKEAVVWDSGGASFQLTHGRYKLRPLSSSGNSDEDSATKLDGDSVAVQFVFEGNWGSSKVTYELAKRRRQQQQQEEKEKQQKPVDAESTTPSQQGSDAALASLDPNPVTKTDFDDFVRFLVSDLSSSSSAFQESIQYMREKIATAPSAAAGGETSSPSSSSSSPSSPCEVIAIGGPTCAFRMSALAVGRFTDLSPPSIRDAVYGKLLDKETAELSAMGFPQPEMLLAKLALIVAVAECVNIQRFVVYPTTGTTLGMLCTDEYWK